MAYTKALIKYEHSLARQYSSSYMHLFMFITHLDNNFMKEINSPLYVNRN